MAITWTPTTSMDAPATDSTITVSVNFGEAVYGLTVGDIVTSSSSINITSITGGSGAQSYMLTFAVTDNTSGNFTVTINAGAVSSDSDFTTTPTTVSPSTLNAASTTPFQIYFDRTTDTTGPDMTDMPQMPVDTITFTTTTLTNKSQFVGGSVALSQQGSPSQPANVTVAPITISVDEGSNAVHSITITERGNVSITGVDVASTSISPATDPPLTIQGYPTKEFSSITRSLEIIAPDDVIGDQNYTAEIVVSWVDNDAQSSSTIMSMADISVQVVDLVEMDLEWTGIPTDVITTTSHTGIIAELTTASTVKPGVIIGPTISGVSTTITPDELASTYNVVLTLPDNTARTSFILYVEKDTLLASVDMKTKGPPGTKSSGLITFNTKIPTPEWGEIMPQVINLRDTDTTNNTLNYTANVMKLTDHEGTTTEISEITHEWITGTITKNSTGASIAFSGTVPTLTQETDYQIQLAAHNVRNDVNSDTASASFNVKVIPIDGPFIADIPTIYLYPVLNVSNDTYTLDLSDYVSGDVNTNGIKITVVDDGNDDGDTDQITFTPTTASLTSNVIITAAQTTAKVIEKVLNVKATGKGGTFNKTVRVNASPSQPETLTVLPINATLNEGSGTLSNIIISKTSNVTIGNMTVTDQKKTTSGMPATSADLTIQGYPTTELSATTTSLEIIAPDNVSGDQTYTATLKVMWTEANNSTMKTSIGTISVKVVDVVVMDLEWTGVPTEVITSTSTSHINIRTVLEATSTAQPNVIIGPTISGVSTTVTPAAPVSTYNVALTLPDNRDETSFILYVEKDNLSVQGNTQITGPPSTRSSGLITFNTKIPEPQWGSIPPQILNLSDAVTTNNTLSYTVSVAAHVTTNIPTGDTATTTQILGSSSGWITATPNAAKTSIAFTGTPPSTLTDTTDYQIQLTVHNRRNGINSDTASASFNVKVIPAPAGIGFSALPAKSVESGHVLQHIPLQGFVTNAELIELTASVPPWITLQGSGTNKSLIFTEAPIVVADTEVDVQLRAKKVGTNAGAVTKTFTVTVTPSALMEVIVPLDVVSFTTPSTVQTAASTTIPIAIPVTFTESVSGTPSIFVSGHKEVTIGTITGSGASRTVNITNLPANTLGYFTLRVDKNGLTASAVSDPIKVGPSGDRYSKSVTFDTRMENLKLSPINTTFVEGNNVIIGLNGIHIEPSSDKVTVTSVTVPAADQKNSEDTATTDIVYTVSSDFSQITMSINSGINIESTRFYRARMRAKASLLNPDGTTTADAFNETTDIFVTVQNVVPQTTTTTVVSDRLTITWTIPNGVQKTDFDVGIKFDPSLTNPVTATTSNPRSIKKAIGFSGAIIPPENVNVVKIPVLGEDPTIISSARLSITPPVDFDGLIIPYLDDKLVDLVPEPEPDE